MSAYTFADVTSNDRLSRLSEIMPRFNQHVQVGDEVALGIEGDALFPYGGGGRPVMKVKSVQRSADDATDVSLVLEGEGGREVIVPRHTVDPSTVWEFTDRGFDAVIGRTVSAASATNAAQPRAAPQDSLAALSARVDEMDGFKKKVVQTMNEMAKEVQMAARGEDCQFCKLFTDTYSAANRSDDSSDASSVSSESSVSSLSDTESDSDSSSSSSSSEGSDFASNLVMS